MELGGQNVEGGSVSGRGTDVSCELQPFLVLRNDPTWMEGDYLALRVVCGFDTH